MYPGNRMLLRKMIGVGFRESLDVYRVPLLISLCLSFVCIAHLFKINAIVVIVLSGFLFFLFYFLLIKKYQPVFVDSLLHIIRQKL